MGLLSRASDDWRNGDQSAEGPLHWPVSVNLARRTLRQALDALERPRGSIHCLCGRAHCPGACLATVDMEHDRAGIAWYNNLSRAERLHWHEVADSAAPADAWRAFQAQG